MTNQPRNGRKAKPLSTEKLLTHRQAKRGACIAYYHRVTALLEHQSIDLIAKDEGISVQALRDRLSRARGYITMEASK